MNENPPEARQSRGTERRGGYVGESITGEAPMVNQVTSLGIPPSDGHPSSGKLLDAIDRLDEVVRLSRAALVLKVRLRRQLACILVKRGVLPSSTAGRPFSPCSVCGNVVGKHPEIHKCGVEG